MHSFWVLSLFVALSVNLVTCHKRKARQDQDTYTKYCCAPNQFESFLSYMGATADGAQPKPVMMNQKVSYDYDNKQISATVYEKNEEVEKVIYKYAQNASYKITPDGKCVQLAINSTMNPPCIPDDAVTMGGVYLGAEDERFNVGVYYLQRGELQIYGTYSPRKCYPVTEGYMGETTSQPVVMTILYSDSTPGIKDPSCFTVPKNCKKAEKDEEEVHISVTHLINKYSRQNPGPETTD